MASSGPIHLFFAETRNTMLFRFTTENKPRRKSFGERTADYKAALQRFLQLERNHPTKIKGTGKDFTAGLWAANRSLQGIGRSSFSPVLGMIDSGLPLVPCPDILAGNPGKRGNSGTS